MAEAELESRVRELEFLTKKQEERLTKIEQWETLVRMIRGAVGPLAKSLLFIATLTGLGTIVVLLFYRVPVEVEKFGFRRIKADMQKRVDDFDMVTADLSNFSDNVATDHKALENGQRMATFKSFLPAKWYGLIVVGLSIDDQVYAVETVQVDTRPVTQPIVTSVSTSNEVEFLFNRSAKDDKSHFFVRVKPDAHRLLVGPSSKLKISVARYGDIERYDWGHGFY